MFVNRFQTFYPFIDLFNRETRVAVLDVGQGDGILILSNQYTVLIDGGRGSSQILIDQLNLLGINGIDLLILSHGDADHAGSIPDLASEFTISKALVGPFTWRDTAGKKALEALRAQGSDFEIGYAGISILLGERDFIEIISPAGVDDSSGSDNDNSLVFIATISGNKLLFAGDAPEEVEATILNERAPGRVDFLLAAHHGSSTSSSAAWLKECAPEFVAISSGKYNSYGHPSAQTLARLELYGVQPARTDNEGALLYSVKKSGIERIPFWRWF